MIVMQTWLVFQQMPMDRHPAMASLARLGSKDCQEAHWLTHKISCDGSSAQHETKNRRDLQNNTLECSEANPMEELQESYIVIKIKHQKIKTNLKIPTSASGEEALELVCKYLRIPPENLKLVSKGKLMNKENILSFLATGSIFQAFGEQAENEDGLDFRDIEVLMAQLSVERNVAVKALRKTGDLIDAILYVSDNM